jgi:hypothetical protein
MVMAFTAFILNFVFLEDIIASVKSCPYLLTATIFIRQDWLLAYSEARAAPTSIATRSSLLGEVET